MIKTLTNVLQAYVGESQARNRYDFYGKVAKKEGYE
ncbi:MAG: rubrerythrin family protein, partial [Candidatus Heimdallarchaeota archaeon]|nr:rubrerythrin family protein [Candidatus Heimdallarchaeota archaeon]